MSCLAVSGWVVAVVFAAGFLVRGFALERWKHVAGERATCWSIANKRAMHLELSLKKLSDERRELASSGKALGTGDNAERLGAMPAATGCEWSATRTVEERRDWPERAVCSWCSPAETFADGTISTGRMRLPCVSCGRSTAFRLQVPV